MKNLQTADEFLLNRMGQSEPLFEIVKQVGKPAVVKETVVMLVMGKLKATDEKDWAEFYGGETREQYLKSLYYVKETAQEEAFKINKLTHYPKVEDYRNNFKKALRIISNFTDEELFLFVQTNESKSK